VLRSQIAAMPDADAVIAALAADRRTAVLASMHNVVPTAAE
jgi:hypothetical protein